MSKDVMVCNREDCKIAIEKLSLKDMVCTERKVIWETIGWYYDVGTNVVLNVKKCDADLEPMGIYSVEYDTCEESDTYHEIVIKELSKGVYLMAEVYGGVLYRTGKNYLGESYQHISCKDVFGIDLKEFENFIKYLFDLSKVGNFYICPNCGKVYKDREICKREEWVCENCKTRYTE